MKVMDKRIIVSLPMALYDDAKRIAKKSYISVSALIRASVLEKIKDEFTPEEMNLIEGGHKTFRSGKGVDWRKVKRG